MKIRPGVPDPDDPSEWNPKPGPEDPSATGGAEAPETPAAPTAPTASGSHEWRVERMVIVAKLVAAAAFAAIPYAFQLDRISRLFGLFIAVVLLIYAGRDLLAPIRLAVDHEAVTVISGYAAHRRIPWRDIERIRILKQRGAEFLEIETVDDVHLLSRYDLSEPPAEAIDTVTAFQDGAAG